MHGRFKAIAVIYLHLLNCSESWQIPSCGQHAIPGCLEGQSISGGLHVSAQLITICFCYSHMFGRRSTLRAGSSWLDQAALACLMPEANFAINIYKRLVAPSEVAEVLHRKLASLKDVLVAILLPFCVKLLHIDALLLLPDRTFLHITNSGTHVFNKI